jgi:hypothetical protein
MMRPERHQPSVSAVRCEALFVSALQRSERPDARQVRLAVAAAMRQYGGCGCAAQVAQEYGEHPEIAAARMQWARGAVAEAFRRPLSRVGRAA